MKEMKLGKCTEIMGIDLGTTNSAVAVYSSDLVPTLLTIGDNQKYTVPSCVMWEGGDNYIVGEQAYRNRYLPNVCYSVKRIMGEDTVIHLKKDGKTKKLSPIEVSSKILKHLKDRVALFYKPLTRCVITVPAYFNQNQIENTMKASDLAGLECVYILKEPTSASYIYSMLGHATSGSVVIYDLGGGTFDLTHMTFINRDNIPNNMINSLKRQYGIDMNSIATEDNSKYFCRIHGTYGNTKLGGDDVDREMAKIVIEEQSLELNDDEKEELYLRCEEYKKAGWVGQDIIVGGKIISLRTEQLHKAMEYVFQKTLNLMQDVDMSTVKSVVLVGGSTKHPYIKGRLKDTFALADISSVLDPDGTVAIGAGAVAKAVANDKELNYQDVLPLPIGVLVDETRVETCVSRNTYMPHSVTKTYYTMSDYQQAITVKVYQGLSSSPEKCTYLGSVRVDGIPPALSGEVSVDINFILNAQGRLRVTSKVAGVEKEETLYVDNIFNVHKEDNLEFGEHQDVFESAMFPDLKDRPEVRALFNLRRTALIAGDTKKAEEIEAIILDLA